MGIRIKNLTKSFRDDVKIKNLNYDFPENGVVAITGDSGVGKTTLARMICGLDNDYSGEISGKGPGNISIAFQEHRLFPNLSALDNVIYANYDRKTEENVALAKGLLSEMGFDDEEMLLKPSVLSGGMKQRVSLARAFLSSAETLILDEATKELDYALKEKILELIRAESEKRLVILITHDISEAEKLNAKILHLSSPE